MTAGCWCLIGQRTARRTCKLPVYRGGLCRQQLRDVRPWRELPEVKVATIYERQGRSVFRRLP